VARPVPDTDLETLDSEWRAERLHGIALELEVALRPESLPLLLWAGYRGALIYLEPESWEGLAAAAPELPAGLGSPLLAVDPVLGGGAEAQAEVEISAEAIEAAMENTPPLHVVLAGPTAERAPALGERFPTRVLLGNLGDGSSGGPLGEQAAETLRYLTERATLMWLRTTSGKAGSELGRTARLTAA